MNGKIKSISHTNFEIIRRLPDDADTLTAMCNALKADFTGKGLVESEENKEQRTKNRKKTNKTLHSHRFITSDIYRKMTETTEILNITTTQLVTLLVFLHNPDPTWTVRNRKHEKHPRIKTIRSKQWHKKQTT